jgi:hypothetical protein
MLVIMSAATNELKQKPSFIRFGSFFLGTNTYGSLTGVFDGLSVAGPQSSVSIRHSRSYRRVGAR